MAPEVYSNATSYTAAVDLWALGCILYRMVVGQRPFPTIDDVFQYQYGRKRFPRLELSLVGMSEVGIEFMERLVHWDPIHRMTADSALEHDWIKSEPSGFEITKELGRYLKNWRQIQEISDRSKMLTSNAHQEHLLQSGFEITQILNPTTDHPALHCPQTAPESEGSIVGHVALECRARSAPPGVNVITDYKATAGTGTTQRLSSAKNDLGSPTIPKISERRLSATKVSQDHPIRKISSSGNAIADNGIAWGPKAVLSYSATSGVTTTPAISSISVLFTLGGIAAILRKPILWVLVVYKLFAMQSDLIFYYYRTQVSFGIKCYEHWVLT